MNLVLASGSPRRKELLLEVGLNFTLYTADFDESTVSLSHPEEGVKELAKGKASAALTKWQNDPSAPFPLTPDTYFLGADTIVVLDGVAMGKPKNEEQAFSMLQSLSGNVHQVYTGVALLSPAKVETFAVKTDVYFKVLSEEEIRAYIATGEPMDKAGAYGIQGLGGALVDHIEGDYQNVVGLPVSETLKRLTNCN